MARKAATASLERQTIYFSERCLCVCGGGSCNIDAMFITLMITKYKLPGGLCLKQMSAEIIQQVVLNINKKGSPRGVLSPLWTVLLDATVSIIVSILSQ